MSPRRADPALAERRREALVKAGYAEILDKGIQGITLDSVVARAGSSKGGALYYFRTKDDLLYSILRWLLAQVDHTLEEVSRSEEPPRGRLAAELEVLFHSAEVNRKLYLVFFDYVSLGARAERFRKLFTTFFERCRKRDMAIVEDGIRQQQFRRVNPADAATTIRALVDGFCLQWLMEPGPAPIENYRDRCRAVLGAYLLR
ncbi:MAG: TetR family transcriptional regulator C-terminal domain-containing protein [Acidobacteria bacterium]|nr:TetR family transcriptional regulator C-terminal domain-containing protein [Acidobacteriota bacterium]